MQRTNEEPREMTVEDYFYNYKGMRCIWLCFRSMEEYD